MSSFWKKSTGKPTRHTDPDEAIARYLEKLHQADVAGASPPASALNGLGDAYLDKDDVASAVDYYRQAAEIYAREGMHTNAIACLKKVRRHAVDEADAGLLLGRYYAAKKLIPDALAELEGFAERQKKVGDYNRAIEAMWEVVQLVPRDAERRERLGDLQRADERQDEAIATYREALALFADSDREEDAERVRDRIEELGGEPAAAEVAVEEPGTPDAASTVRPTVEDEDVEPAAAETPAPPPEIGPDESDLAPRPAGAPHEPAVEETDSREDEAEAEADLSLGLEIERTSYEDQEREAIRQAEEDESEKLTIAQQTSTTDEPVEREEIQSSAVEESGGPEGPVDEKPSEEEPVGEEIAEPAEEEPPERERIELDGSTPLADAAAELEKAALDLEEFPEPPAVKEEADEPPASEPDDSGPSGPEPETPDESIVPEPQSHEEMVALAEQHVRAGETDQAAKYLLVAAEGLREERAWQDAAHAYGRLADIGEATSEDFEDWIECARQAGRASEVLEALSTAARWHLEQGNVEAARRSAEEMFLVDPDSETATEILERIGSLPSR